MDYRDNRQRWAESHQVVHFYAGQWCTFTPALTREVKTLQKFVAVHASIHNHFKLERHLNRREVFKQNRSAALAEWRQLAA